MAKKISLKDLTKSIKSGDALKSEEQSKSEEPQEKNVNEANKEPEVAKTKAPTKPVKKVKSGDNTDKLLQFIEEIKLKDYDATEAVYIDKDAHEILKRLKASNKLHVGKLVSYLIEEWIRKEIDPILKLTEKKKNKFL